MQLGKIALALGEIALAAAAESMRLDQVLQSCYFCLDCTLLVG